ncbi:MAG TPA: hypothetical protein VNH64_02110 [Parvularculaceae bacterium]|nr:hypothetical protein [Parvularculaceae bacterium]
MPKPFTREEFQTPTGRRRAWRALMIGDHGLLRLFYDNSYEVSRGKVWRTYQPSPAALARWKKRGIQTVVNLRGDKPDGRFLLEQEACARLGLRLETFQVFSREPPSKEVLRGARRLFDEIDYPAVMHCKSGADRVGLMSTLYLFLHESRPLDEAMRQLSFRYGHVRHGKTGVIDKVFADYVDYAATKGLELSSVDGFFDWVDHVYDPAATKESFLATWWGNLLVERIFNRE